MPDPAKTVTLVDELGHERAVPEAEVQYRLDRGWTQQTAEGHAQKLADQVEADVYGGAAGTVLATGAALARGASGGASDALIAGMGGGETLAKLRRQHEGISTGAEIVGGLTGIGRVAGKVGARIAGTGGGTVAQVARAGVGTATEGAILGAGQGVSELALSSDPLTLERAASVIGSNAIFGAATGGALGVSGKIVERGLVRAKAALDEGASAGLGRAGVAEDLATLDRKGLRAAEKVELDAIEAARVPKRAELADEIKSFRKELKEQKVWLATKGVDDAELKAAAIGKRTLKADKALDNLLDDPKALAENPKAALSHLRKQEAALDELVNKHGPRLRETVFKADETGTRVAALDNAATALEKNRALQAKITELAAKPASKRLDDIASATDGLSAPRAAPGLAQDLLGGSVFGHVAGAFSGLPIVGPMIGAKAAKLVGDLVGGKLGSATSEAAARGSKAISTFLDVGRKIAPAAPVLATKVLSSVAFATPGREKRLDKQPAPSLARSFKARSEEIRSHIEVGPDGTSQMRASSRAAIADRLAPIAAVSPLLADRIESQKALAVEFLASKLPRRPNVDGIPIGPDKWQPSDMEMRTWARYVAAVEDPQGVVERLAAGSVTPEDCEAMRAVYPEMHSDITRSIVEQLGTLRQSLPYQRRLALSMFSGVAVDPALDPKVLRILQGSFEAEEGTEGGTEAPKPQPAFGSVSKPQGTPAQERGG